MNTQAQNDLERYSIGGLYRLLRAVEGSGYTVSMLASTFGENRAQARKYVELALGLGLVRGEVNERLTSEELRERRGWRPVSYAKGFDRYYSTTRRGDKVLKWLTRYAAGKPIYVYPDPPLLRGSTRRRPRFPKRL